MLLTAVLALAFVSLNVGPSGVTLLNADASAQAAVILAEIRAPRAILAVLVGGSLGLSGAAMQGLLRNPLADPGLIGVSGSAAFGAVLAFYFGLSAVSSLALPLGGMAAALASVTLLVLLAGRNASAATLILAGIAISSIAAAALALALNFSSNPFALYEIVFWLMGSLADRSFEHVLLAAPFVGLGAAMLLRLGPALDALSLGEDTANSLGFAVARVRWAVVVGTALAVGAVTSVAGAVGFVGLVVPHLLRPLVGHKPGRLLLSSALGGAALTLAADIAVRLMPSEQEIKLGVVTALIGAPFFLAMVLRQRRELA